MPAVERFHQRYRGRGLQVIGINVEGRERAVLDYLDEGGYSFLMLFDEGNWKSPVLQSYGVKAIPRSFLIDRRGNIVFFGNPGRLTDEIIESSLQ
jgi:hypothetical protein